MIHFKKLKPAQSVVQLFFDNKFYFSLTLNLSKVNSIQSPESSDAKSAGCSIDKGTLSSDTYHTAASSCSSVENVNKPKYLMSDSGVELRPSSMPQDESDLSSNEDKVRSRFLIPCY